MYKLRLRWNSCSAVGLSKWRRATKKTSPTTNKLRSAGTISVHFSAMTRARGGTKPLVITALVKHSGRGNEGRIIFLMKWARGITVEFRQGVRSWPK